MAGRPAKNGAAAQAGKYQKNEEFAGFFNRFAGIPSVDRRDVGTCPVFV
jgi:hypothetical protein